MRRYLCCLPFAFASVCLFFIIKSCLFFWVGLGWFGLVWVGLGWFGFDWISLSLREREGGMMREWEKMKRGREKGRRKREGNRLVAVTQEDVVSYFVFRGEGRI